MSAQLLGPTGCRSWARLARRPAPAAAAADQSDRPDRTPSDRIRVPRTFGSGCRPPGTPYDPAQMTEIPPYLFIVTSTALVLGAAITIRGLLGFRPIAAPAATDAGAGAGVASTPDASGTSEATDTPGANASPAAAPTPPQAYAVRDLREPIVMTIAGILICVFTSLAIAALIHSA